DGAATVDVTSFIVRAPVPDQIAHFLESGLIGKRRVVAALRSAIRPESRDSAHEYPQYRTPSLNAGTARRFHVFPSCRTIPSVPMLLVWLKLRRRTPRDG